MSLMLKALKLLETQEMEAASSSNSNAEERPSPVAPPSITTPFEPATATYDLTSSLDLAEQGLRVVMTEWPAEKAEQTPPEEEALPQLGSIPAVEEEVVAEPVETSIVEEPAEPVIESSHTEVVEELEEAEVVEEVEPPAPVIETPAPISPPATGRKSRPRPTSFELALRAELVNSQSGEPLRRVAARIAAQFPGERGGSLALAGIDAGPHLAGSAASIALLLAEGGYGRVLLIDANLAEKSLTDRFERRGDAGLAEVLAGRRPWEACLVPTAQESLEFLPAGRGVAPDRLSALPQLAQLLPQLESEFTFTVIEAGCATAQFCRQVTRVAESTYLLMQLGGTLMAEAVEATAQLRLVGARLMSRLVPEPAHR